MVTNTVVITLTPTITNKDTNQAESGCGDNTKACGDVAFFRLQAGIDNFEELIAKGDINVVTLTKSLKKVLMVCINTDISSQIYNCLLIENAFYKVHYSRQDTIVSKNADNKSYLKIPKDFKSKFLISPPRTPKYKKFNYMVLEEDPVEINTLNNQILEQSEIVDGDDKTRILLKNSPTGVNITLTDCCDDYVDFSLGERMYKTQLPPKNIFDDM